MEYFQDLYNELLSHVPEFLHPVISLVLASLVVYSVFQVLKQNFVYLIVLVVLLPATIPFLKNIIDAIISVIKFLL